MISVEINYQVISETPYQENDKEYIKNKWKICENFFPVFISRGRRGLVFSQLVHQILKSHTVLSVQKDKVFMGPCVHQIGLVNYQMIQTLMKWGLTKSQDLASFRSYIANNDNEVFFELLYSYRL